MLIIIPAVDMASEAFVLMSVGLGLSATLNVASIRFLNYGIHPLAYLSFPIGAAITLSIINATLPICINLHEISAKMLDHWESGAAEMVFVGRVRAGYEYKAVKAMRPIRIYAGFCEINFYMLDKTLLKTYFSAIMEWTITLLITFKPRG